MATAFGPQSPNYTTTRPARSTEVSAGVDTWAKDCSAAGANDGTILNADFFNVIIANLREVVDGAGLALDNTNDELLYQAIVAIAEASVPAVTASRGIKRNGNDIESTLGDGSRTLLVSTGLQPALDRLDMWSESANAIAETSIYQAIKAVLTQGAGGILTANDTAGTIAIGSSLAPVDNALWHIGSASTGTATALVTALTPAPQAATNGLCMRVPITTTNGANPTLQFTLADGVTTVTKPIVLNSTGAALTGNEMVGGIGYEADLEYDGTSLRLHNPVIGNLPSAARAWVSYDGTTTPPTIKTSYNVTSVTRTAAGCFTITFSTPMPSANYAVVAMSSAFVNGGTPTATFPNLDHENFTNPKTTTSVSLLESAIGSNLGTPDSNIVIFSN